MSLLGLYVDRRNRGDIIYSMSWLYKLLERWWVNYCGVRWDLHSISVSRKSSARTIIGFGKVLSPSHFLPGQSYIQLLISVNFIDHVAFRGCSSWFPSSFCCVLYIAQLKVDVLADKIRQPSPLFKSRWTTPSSLLWKNQLRASSFNPIPPVAKMAVKMYVDLSSSSSRLF